VSAPPAIAAARERLSAWLREAALPLWWDSGADLAAGGFHDRLDTAGRPIPGPQRARVQARQVFVYAAAPDFGWDGPWRVAMDHGLAALEHAHRHADGFYRAWTDDNNAELYDQAFVLLAWAAAYGHGMSGARAAALDLFARLPADSAGGFAELAGEARLANPNMHLFESFLAWAALDEDGPWREAAAGQARLALTRLIDPATGALGEFFTRGWIADAPQVVEPGHQFEWAWLLMRWSLIGGDAAALAAALRLMDIGETCGVDAGRNLAVNALDGDLVAVDVGDRLWPQTERLRAHLLAARLAGAPWDPAVRAAESLDRYLETPTPGLWRDSLEGEFPFAPASSLYHLAGAILELDAACLPPSPARGEGRRLAF
jgi:mannose-6-phosphate isomerase